MTALDGTDHAAIRNFVRAVRIKTNGGTFAAGADLDIHHGDLIAIGSQFLARLQGKTRVSLRCCQSYMTRFGPVITDARCHGFGRFGGKRCKAGDRIS